MGARRMKSMEGGDFKTYVSVTILFLFFNEEYTCEINQAKNSLSQFPTYKIIFKHITTRK